jgi:heme exporter protein D
VITKPKRCRTVRNHTIIALIIVSFFQTISDLPLTLEYLRIGQAPSSTFCLIWNFFALSNYAVGVWTMTWASLERHLLVFHDRLIATFHGKIFLHYIPLIASLSIPWIYYFVLIFFYPCTNTFDRSLLFCGWCCYAYNNQLVFFNWLAFGVTPTCSITLLSLWLIIRVVTQKRRVQQRVNWRQHRYMVIQLLTVSCLYIFFDAPTIIIGLIRLILPTFAADIQTLYLYYIVYLLPLLVPFVCLSTSRELWAKTRAQVHPPMLLTHSRSSRRDKKAKTLTRVTQTTKL